MRTDKPTPLFDSLAKFKDTLSKRQKYIKNEHQAYGLLLADELKDWKNRSLYIRLAKTVDKNLLETARYFVKDHPPHAVQSPARLFMWKLKDLRQKKSQPGPTPPKPSP